MGIFNRKPIYISDRGDEFVIEDMAPSHLLNVLNLHMNQLKVLCQIVETASPARDKEFGIQRLTGLENTVALLSSELLTRDPAKDHDESNTNGCNSTY